MFMGTIILKDGRVQLPISPATSINGSGLTKAQKVTQVSKLPGDKLISVSQQGFRKSYLLTLRTKTILSLFI